MENYSIKLIDNTYSVSAAREVITSLIEDKIKSLNFQIFAALEKGVLDLDHAKNRVAELEEEKNRLENELAALNRDEMLEVVCEVRVKSKLAELA